MSVQLKSRLGYDPSTGLFVWLPHPRRRIVGTAGTLDRYGYVSILYHKRKYLAHRLAWYFVHGYWPADDIDHINGDKADNRIINLREATSAQGQANRPTPRSNTSGTKGVVRHKGAWQAQIGVNSQTIYLGLFKSKEEAINARKQAEEKYQKEFRYRRDNMTKQMKLNENGKLVVEKPTAEQVKLDKVTETYIKIRDARTALRKQYEAEDGELKAQLETLDSFLLGTLQNLGVESARTKHGTVYRSTDTKASCEDWSAFGNWIIENNAIEALERRVKKSFITTYMEDNKGELPPGINVLREYTVTIRRS